MEPGDNGQQRGLSAEVAALTGRERRATPQCTVLLCVLCLIMPTK